jgi:hypothetical protein
MKDPTLRSGTSMKQFGAIKMKYDKSYKLGEIRTTEAHIHANDSIRTRKVQMMDKRMSCKKMIQRKLTFQMQLEFKEITIQV